MRFRVLLVALAAALCWLAWLGWDHSYQVDPLTGATSGPYQAWQVVGCALSLLVLQVAALLTGLRSLPVGAALTAGFAVPWTVQAATTDDTGLYAVGAVLLVFGLAAASALVSVVTLRLRRR